MNIIGGSARGRKLQTLPGEATRPTQAKVRAALFNILQAWVPDAAWLDLYAGSGAIGLEAASRGARRVVLVEHAADALKVIRANVAATKLPAEVLGLGVDAALRQLAGQAFDVVFLDPPYALDPQPALDAAGSLVAAHGRLVLEHARDRTPPPTAGPLALRDTRPYSDSALSFYA